jgi:hypothetical protein
MIYYLVDDLLVHIASQAKNRMNLKIKGDYLWYLAEVVHGDKKGVVDQSEKEYKKNFEMKKKEMNPIYAIRLNLECKCYRRLQLRLIILGSIGVV